MQPLITMLWENNDTGEHLEHIVQFKKLITKENAQ